MTSTVRSKPSVRAFISHSSQDAVLAETLKAAVEGDGISCFYAPTDIKNEEKREVWRDHLEAEIKQANLVLLLYTDAAGASDEVYKEIEAAHKLGKDIWLLQEPKVRITSRFHVFEVGTRYQAFVFERETAQTVFGDVRRVIDKEFGRVDLPSRGTINHENNPYPGTPYTALDQDFFFGRNAECNQLLADVLDGKERVLFVYGPSGAGKSSLLDAGFRRLISKRWWFSKKIEPSLANPDTMAVDMWRFAERQLQPERQAPDGPDSELILDILRGIEALNQPHYLFWFDHVERLLTLDSERIFMFFRIAADLLQRTDRIHVIISFRQEVLSQAKNHAQILPNGSWREWFLRRLSRDGALDSIILPARIKNGVTIERDLANALVDELARVEFEDHEGKKIATINPVSLQLVCRRLWTLGKPGFSGIGAIDLKSGGSGLKADVKQFVENALQNHLKEAIDKIALALGGEHVEEKKELIRLGLLQFVSEDRRRQQLKEETDGKGVRVGRLQGDVIDKLYEEKLLQRTDIGLSVADYRYELVHDSLAEAINGYRNKVKLLQTLNTLESMVRGAEHDINGRAQGFNRNTDLLAELEESRREETGFFDNEREFLFRWALGDQRRAFTKAQISLEGWARLLAHGSAGTFAGVLYDAMSPKVGDDSVRCDAIRLLMSGEFRALLPADQRQSLGSAILEAALEATPEVQEAACVAVCEIREPAGGAELFAMAANRAKGGKALRAIGWLRHAADRREIAAEPCRAFEAQWRAAPVLRRARILSQLWRQRALGSFGWMFFVVVVSTVLTAIGAGLAFVPMGFFGASLTLADKNAGWAKGLFHGIAGGAFWAIGISTALLAYWVILRGGRVTARLRNWIPASIVAGLGGFIAGIALALTVGFVFQPASLYSAGWLRAQDTTTRLLDMFWYTRHGWWTPIFGFAVGAGVCWSLQKITADPRVEAFLHQQPGVIRRPSQAILAIIRIFRLVMNMSWRIFVPLIFAGFLTFQMLVPGPGICDETTNGSKARATACTSGNLLAPMPARIAGIVFIIWVGGIFLEVGILFGIFTARTGVRLDRDEHFLQAFPD